MERGAEGDGSRQLHRVARVGEPGGGLDRRVEDGQDRVRSGDVAVAAEPGVPRQQQGERRAAVQLEGPGPAALLQHDCLRDDLRVAFGVRADRRRRATVDDQPHLVAERAGHRDRGTRPHDDAIRVAPPGGGHRPDERADDDGQQAERQRGRPQRPHDLAVTHGVGERVDQCHDAVATEQDERDGPGGHGSRVVGLHAREATEGEVHRD